MSISNNRFRAALRRRWTAFGLFTLMAVALGAAAMRVQHKFDNFLYSSADGPVFGFGTRSWAFGPGRGVRRESLYLSYQSRWHHPAVNQRLVIERRAGAGQRRHVEFGVMMMRPIPYTGENGHAEVQRIDPEPLRWERLGMCYSSLRGFGMLLSVPEASQNAGHGPAPVPQIHEDVVRAFPLRFIPNALCSRWRALGVFHVDPPALLARPIPQAQTWAVPRVWV